VAAIASSGRADVGQHEPVPGSTTPQPNEPDAKRAKAIALRMGSGPLMRTTSPSERRLSTTRDETTGGGPRT
jgi:hypothetical protein